MVADSGETEEEVDADVEIPEPELVEMPVLLDDVEDELSGSEMDAEDDALSDSERTVPLRTSAHERKPAVKVT